MENSKKIQIGLLVLVGALLVVNLFGGFEGLFGGSSSDSVRDQARNQIATTTDVTNPTTPATSAAAAAEPAAPAGPTTTMSFKETEFDFGTVDQGEKVTHNNRDIYYLPNFINPDIAILLSTIMMEKRTNEYRLRKIFGPAFQNKYSSMVKRLIGMGLLSRNVDGSLEITDVAVNDVGRLLERYGFLKFGGG